MSTMNGGFRPMLAETMKDPTKLKFPLMVSPKINGIRLIIRNGYPLTRSLKLVPNRFIRSELSGLEGLDGEVTIGDPKAPDTWNNTSTGVMSFEGEPRFHYHIFDAPDFPAPFSVRLALAQNRVHKLARPHITLVPHLVCRNLDDVLRHEKDFVSQGYEGLMIRAMDGPYKHGRASVKEGYLLKMKRWDDSEAEVTGIEPLMHNANKVIINALGLTERSSEQVGLIPLSKVGALICQDAKGREFKLGSGFTEAQRVALWQDQTLIGRIVTYKHVGLTPKGLPLFPIFLGFRNRMDMS